MLKPAKSKKQRKEKRPESLQRRKLQKKLLQLLKPSFRKRRNLPRKRKQRSLAAQRVGCK